MHLGSATDCASTVCAGSSYSRGRKGATIWGGLVSRVLHCGLHMFGDVTCLIHTTRSGSCCDARGPRVAGPDQRSRKLRTFCPLGAAQPRGMEDVGASWSLKTAGLGCGVSPAPVPPGPQRCTALPLPAWLPATPRPRPHSASRSAARTAPAGAGQSRPPEHRRAHHDRLRVCESTCTSIQDKTHAPRATHASRRCATRCTV